MTTRQSQDGPARTGDDRLRQPQRQDAAPERASTGLMALQAGAGNAAVVQMLRQAGHSWAQEQHQHGAGCGHQQTEQAAPVQRSAVHDVLRSSGSPLDSSIRTDMEARLGADFSDVRIHNDSAAKASAAEVGARAYTSGSHVVVGEGGADRHTLAHELTHVIQQRQGPVAGTDNGSGLKVSDPSDRFEREAEANATRALSGEAPVQRAAGPDDAGAGDTGPGVVQRALVINGNDVSQEYKAATATADDSQKAAMLDAKVNQILTEMDSEIGAKFQPDEQASFHAERQRITAQLRKAIVEPRTMKGMHPVLKVEVGKHPDFGAKNRDIQVNNVEELARGLMGWVYAKDKRREEKQRAHGVKTSPDVEMFLNSLLLRVNSATDSLKANLTAEQRAVMEEELTTGVAHLKSQPLVIDPATGNEVHDPEKAGKPFGAYLTYFSQTHGIDPKFQPGQPLERLATQLPEVGGGIQAVLRDPEKHSFRDKIMVLHDLMEYFGPARHFPRTMGTDQLAEVGGQDIQSTAGINPVTGARIETTDRGQNLVPNLRKPGEMKEHPSTRNEHSDTTKFARAHRVPVWAGQSFTAARMFKLAQAAGGTKREIAAVAWGIFAFWRLDFDHTTALAYHTLHEVMDIAQNFGVPYDIKDQYAGQADVTMTALTDSLKALGSTVDHHRQQLELSMQGLRNLQNDDTQMVTDELELKYANALNAAAGIQNDMVRLAQGITDLLARVARNPQGREKTLLVQDLQSGIAAVPTRIEELKARFNANCVV
ncbi:DUF4157 domain-containing protein [Streptomyces sp. NPDC006704]|uniref:eCIS core domain-containing protein n=1 Tax=Streptomyces sp. NPDC006704 TaxID=3364760 RepID=UPI0036AADEBC